MKKMMLEPPPSQIFPYPVKLEEEVKPNNVWEYAIDVPFKISTLHPEGKASKMGKISRYGIHGAILPME